MAIHNNRECYRALTLIEVVASLVLLAATATLLLTAQGRSLDQLRSIREQEIAAVLTHELIATWKLNPPGKHSATEGRWQSHAAWRWRRQLAPYPLTIRSVLQEVTLTLYRTDQEGNDVPVSTHTWLERPDEP